MATFYAASSGFGPTSGGGNTRTISHSAPAGAKTAILVTSDTTLTNSLSWGSATLTLRQSYNVGAVGYEALYTIDNPPSSAANIIAGFASSQANVCIQAINAIPGAGNALTYRSSNKSTDSGGASANSQVSLTTVAGDACVALGAVGYGGSSGGIDFDDYNGATIRVESEDGNYTGAFASSKTASGTSTSIGAALTSDGTSWDVFGVAWEEAAGGGGGGFIVNPMTGRRGEFVL